MEWRLEGGKFALIKQQRHPSACNSTRLRRAEPLAGSAHAKQFRRANRSLRKLKTYLGRVMRDIVRKTRGRPDLEAACARELMLAGRVHAQNKNLRSVRGQPAGTDLRVFSLHAPEVECIGKGKAHKPYEFGVKVSVATTLKRSKGGQFVTQVAALPGNPPPATPPSFARRGPWLAPPYDGHTLKTVISAIEAQVGATLTRIITDAGYKGHNAPETHRFRVYTAGQKRGMTPAIKRQMRRRAAVEPVIGHLKDDHRMNRNYLVGPVGDAANAVLAAVGYNFRRLLAWLFWLSALWAVLNAESRTAQMSQTA